MIFDLPYSKESFTEFLKEFLADYELDERTVRVSNASVLTNVNQLGVSREANVTVFDAECDESDSNKRIEITRSAFKMLREHGIRNAIIAFHHGKDQWRLSLLTSTLELKDGKIIKRDSNPRRFSYLLGVGAKTKTPYKYLVEKGKVSDIKSLKDRFSIEVVNKQFYESIAELFTKLVGGERGKTKYPGQLKIEGRASQNSEHQEFAVRLIGRIVFGWFLKEKKSKDGVPIVSYDLLSLRAVAEHSEYYHRILEPLFFELLNKRKERRHPLLQEAPFSNVPYLNGGLFSPQDNDYYEQNTFKGEGNFGAVSIPNRWFEDFFLVLEQYNFTVDENTSYDVDLSIDPEMLGRIFENLLAEINPETGESARKSTGSFYTPREIVDYMVDNSLFEYLSDKTKIEDEKLRAIISWGLEDDIENPLTNIEKEKIVNSLAGLTILDPACGSGAFPMGILQKVVYILQQVDEKAELWFRKQIENIPSPEFRKELEEKHTSENYDYIRKLGVIRESIFGVDIQTIATEIAKLRCFLTLIIEEDVDDDKDNRGIHPLPNLDFKFVTANSLIGLPEETRAAQGSLLEDTSDIDSLRSIRDEYFTANAEHRHTLKAAFQSVQLTMFRKALDIYRSRDNISRRYNLLMDWHPFDNRPTEWFDSEWMFGVENFDIVIANPPYIHLEKMKDVANKLYKPLGFKTYEARGDLYSLFYETGINILKDGGILTYITSNKWMRAGYGISLRNFFLDYTNPIQLIDLGGGVFESATVDTSIIILKREKYKGNMVATAASKELTVSNMTEYVQHNTVSAVFKHDESWGILSPIEQSIKEKIEKNGTPLKDWDLRINYGIKTGLNEAFIIDNRQRQELIAQDPKSAEIIRPILRGKDIKRNSYKFGDQYVILAYFGSHNIIPTEYPAIYKYLKQFEEKLKQRGQCRYTSSGQPNVGAEYPGQHHWLELDNNPRQEYMDDFNKQKIVFSRISGNQPCFAIDSKGFMTNDTGYIITGNDLEYLLGQLTSDVIWFAFTRFYMGGGIEKEFKVNNLTRLPVPKPDSQLIEFTEAEINFISSALRP